MADLPPAVAALLDTAEVMARMEAEQQKTRAELTKLQDQVEALTDSLAEHRSQAGPFIQECTPRVIAALESDREAREVHIQEVVARQERSRRFWKAVAAAQPVVVTVGLVVLELYRPELARAIRAALAAAGMWVE